MNCGDSFHNDGACTVHVNGDAEDWCHDCRYDNSQQCDNTGKYYPHNESFVSVRVRGMRIEEWHADANDCDYFWCDISQEYYCSSHFDQSETDQGETICGDIAGDWGYYWDNHHEWYAQQPEDCIPGYHDGYRNWPIPSGGDTYGVELETYCEDYKDLYENMLPHFTGERDGSLDMTYGVEYISPPQLLHNCLNDWKRMIDTINAHGGDSGDVDGNEYGMHVSIGRQTIDIEHQVKFVAFINTNPNLSSHVADRRSSYAKFNIRDIEDARQAVRYGGNGPKYSATNICSNRIEVRIFAGTVEWWQFAKNIEYVASVLAYVRSNSANKLTDNEYIAWMVDKKEVYPQLYSFLKEKQYFARLEIRQKFDEKKAEIQKKLESEGRGPTFEEVLAPYQEQLDAERREQAIRSEQVLVPLGELLRRQMERMEAADMIPFAGTEYDY
jgi:hypothetical protein